MIIKELDPIPQQSALHHTFLYLVCSVGKSKVTASIPAELAPPGSLHALCFSLLNPDTAAGRARRDRQSAGLMLGEPMSNSGNALK